MGGSGSGGYNFKGRPTVEAVPRINVNYLRRTGMFSTEAKGRGQLGHNEITITRPHPDLLELTLFEKKKQILRSWIGLNWLCHPRYIGNHQIYFVCPKCRRHCMEIFLFSHFACRKCHRLPYISQRRGNGRNSWKIDQLARRLKFRRRQKRKAIISRMEKLLENYGDKRESLCLVDAWRLEKIIKKGNRTK